MHKLINYVRVFANQKRLILQLTTNREDYCMPQVFQVFNLDEKIAGLFPRSILRRCAKTLIRRKAKGYGVLVNHRTYYDLPTSLILIGPFESNLKDDFYRTVCDLGLICFTSGEFYSESGGI